MNFAKAIAEALDIALEQDDKVFLLGEDIADPGGGVFHVTQGLSTKYGTDRVRNTPISEQAIIGAAIGSAIAGHRPVAEVMMMNFLTVAMDQLTNHAAKLRYMSGGQTGVPMVVRTATGAGFQFGAQHSDMLESWFVHVPGLKVVVPSTPADAKGLMLSSIFDDDPVLFVEQSFHYFRVSGEVPAGDVRVPLGKAAVSRRGSDATVISYGRQAHEARVLAEKLAQEGIDLEVIDLRTLAPLDITTVLESVARTKRAVIVHEAVRRNGMGAELAATISEELFGELAAPVRRVAGANTPVPYAKELEEQYMATPEAVEAAVRGLLR
jgi:pyruvate dehydrogenase E1 component beta subunit